MSNENKRAAMILDLRFPGWRRSINIPGLAMTWVMLCTQDRSKAAVAEAFVLVHKTFVVHAWEADDVGLHELSAGMITSIAKAIGRPNSFVLDAAEGHSATQEPIILQQLVKQGGIEDRGYVLTNMLRYGV